MSNEIIIKPIFEQNISIHESLVEATKEFMEASLSASTRKFYKIDWRIFSKWCLDNKINPLPIHHDALCIFLTDQTKKGFCVSTLVRRLAAIKLCHDRAGFNSPTKHPSVITTLQGIRRSSNRIIVKKSPATAERIHEMILHCPDNITGLRDKAILLLGFAGAFRRSELVALTINDIELTDDGMRVIIRRSKTDQEGKGFTLAIPNGTNFRIVDTLFIWLKAAKIVRGHLFRGILKNGKVKEFPLTPESIARIVKQYARKCGYNVGNFSGHSLRAGFLTSAAKYGASISKMMEISRHADIQTLAGYIRNENLFENHAGEKFL